jgi:hypothetical protein
MAILTQPVKDRVAAATVRFERGGQGVLVPGGLILTAAHVVNWPHTGAGVTLVMGVSESALDVDDEELVQKIDTAGGERLFVYPYAVEQVANLAVLGVLDNDNRWRYEADAFKQFCKTTPPVALAVADFQPSIVMQWEYRPMSAHILTHTGQWIWGQVRLISSGHRTLVLEPIEPIKDVTSGSPVVTDDGFLLGVVSRFQEMGMWCRDNPDDVKALRGIIQRPHLTAPVWLTTRMLRSEGDVGTVEAEEQIAAVIGA